MTVRRRRIRGDRDTLSATVESQCSCGGRNVMAQRWRIRSETEVRYRRRRRRFRPQRKCRRRLQQRSGIGSGGSGKAAEGKIHCLLPRYVIANLSAAA